MPANTLVETVVSGVLTGGATAATTIWGFFRTTKERLEKLESLVGKPDPKSGMLLAVQLLQDALARLQEQFEKLEERVKRQDEWGAVGSVRTPMPFQSPFVDDGRQREILRRLTDLEDEMKRLDRRIEGWSSDLEEMDEKRSSGISKLREELASVNGLLRGLMAAMDFEPRR